MTIPNIFYSAYATSIASRRPSAEGAREVKRAEPVLAQGSRDAAGGGAGAGGLLPAAQKPSPGIPVATSPTI